MALRSIEKYSTAQPLVPGKNFMPTKYRESRELYPAVNILSVAACKKLGNVQPQDTRTLTLYDYIDFTEERDMIVIQMRMSSQLRAEARFEEVAAPNRARVLSSPYEAYGDRAVSGVLKIEEVDVSFTGVLHQSFPGWIAVDPASVGGRTEVYSIDALRSAIT